MSYRNTALAAVITRSSVIAVVVVAAAAAWVRPASAAVMLINPSFEAPDIANGSAAAAGVNGQGWTTGTAGNAPFLLDNNTTQAQWFNAPVPDGQQANTLAATSFFTQQLNDNITGPVPSAPGLSFNVSFYVGRRKDAFGDGPGEFNVRLQEFNGATYTGVDYARQDYQTATDAAGTTIDLGVGVGLWTLTPVNVTLTIPANLNGGTAGRNVRLAFADGTGDEATIDAVAVSQIPEPAAAALLASAAAPLLLARRRRRRP